MKQVQLFGKVPGIKVTINIHVNTLASRQGSCDCLHKSLLTEVRTWLIRRITLQLLIISICNSFILCVAYVCLMTGIAKFPVNCGCFCKILNGRYNWSYELEQVK